MAQLSWSARRSNWALPSQSFQASSIESLTPSRRCSGELTKNRPPKDQNACPPRSAGPCWSTSATVLPAATSSCAATSPAMPAPTTSTSASMCPALPATLLVTNDAEVLVIDHQLEAAPRGLAEAFGVCLASVTEVPLADVPLPGDDLPRSLGAWRNWLAERGSGLVPIKDAGRFQWAGWWIALVGDGEKVGSDERLVAALAF